MRIGTFFALFTHSRIFGFLLLVIIIFEITLTAFNTYSAFHTYPAPIVKKDLKRQKLEVFFPPDGQGLYEACSPSEGTICLEHLQTMAAGGFKLVVNYNQMYGNAQQEIAYANEAQTVGMKVIWAMNDTSFWNGQDLKSHFKAMGATCNCKDNAGFIEYFINLVKNLPSTWGYYIGDEVNPSERVNLKTFSDLIKRIDPMHPRLFVGCGRCENSGPSYTETLDPMVDTSDVIGLDYYPLDVGYKSVANTSKAAMAVQAVANRYSKEAAMVLQSFSFSEYNKHTSAPFPTYTQMRLMRDLTLQNSHPLLILWYSYFDILKSDNPTAHWIDLVKAAGANVTPNSSPFP